MVNLDQSKDFLGAGIAFPLSVNADGLIAMNALEDHVRQSILLILQTAKGERVMRPDFGARLRDLTFEPLNQATITLAQHYVQEALTRFEPRIEVLNVEVRFSQRQQDRSAYPPAISRAVHRHHLQPRLSVLYRERRPVRAVPPPVLDQRDDDQILQQLRKLAARLVPEWKGDRDLKPDAGTMLHRIFTRLMEITLERLNKAPSKNLYAFLNAAGVSLLPPVPARVPLTFSLTSGSAPVLVPQGTRAGTTPKAEQQPVDFETTADLTVVPATLIAVRTMDPGWDRSSDHTALINGSGSIGFSPFVGTTRLSHGLFLGHQQLLNFSEATVEVSFPGVPGEIPDHFEKNSLAMRVEGESEELGWQD